jgi:hypothetical protein
MSHRADPRKYDPLTAYLAAFAGNEVTLTLAEVEQIIGTPLPRSAGRAAFWSNTREQVTLPPWRAAGWRVRRTHLSGDQPAVTFGRESPDTTA